MTTLHAWCTSISEILPLEPDVFSSGSQTAVSPNRQAPSGSFSHGTLDTDDIFPVPPHIAFSRSNTHARGNSHAGYSPRHGSKAASIATTTVFRSGLSGVALDRHLEHPSRLLKYIKTTVAHPALSQDSVLRQRLTVIRARVTHEDAAHMAIVLVARPLCLLEPQQDREQHGASTEVSTFAHRAKTIGTQRLMTSPTAPP